MRRLLYRERYTFRRLAPAEIQRHVPLYQRRPGAGLIPIERTGAVDRIQEILPIITLECETAAFAGHFIVGLHRIPQPTNTVDHRNGTIAHSDHLAKATRLTLGRHQIDVAATVNAVGKLGWNPI